MKNKAKTNIEMWNDAYFVSKLASKYVELKIRKFGMNEELREEIDKLNKVQEFMRSKEWEINEY